MCDLAINPFKGLANIEPIIKLSHYGKLSVELSEENNMSFQ